MHLQKSAAEKIVKSATRNNYSAVRIDKDSTLEYKALAQREIVKDVEKLIRKNRSVTIIVITD